MAEEEPKAQEFINYEAQSQIKWREGDVVLAVPAKSGTTWTMNISHQLREGGDPDFADLYKEVKWLEFAMPGQSTADLVKEVDDMPLERRRIFKSHSAPPRLPYLPEEEGNPNVKYIVVLRNPEEACVSMYPFIQGVNTTVLKNHYNKPPFGFATFAEFLEKLYFARGPESQENVFNFVKNWWPHRHNSNVLFLHFSDMKKDHEGSIRKIADFLGYSPSPAQFEKISEYSSFKWMKEHGDKFEMPTFFEEGPFLLPGTMVRKGKTGVAQEDGMTPEVSERIRQVGITVLGENSPAMEWFYKGGPLPE